jgi:glycosyltransferase involved in cell wall biosynthesis
MRGGLLYGAAVNVKEKIGVLFLQSQEGFGADSAIHAHIMRYLDRERFEVHVACTAGSGAEPDSLRILRGIPGLRVRPTQFAPGFRGRDLETIWQSARAARSFPADFLALRRYVKTNRIRLIHSTDRPRDAVYGVTLGKLTRARSIVHVHVKWSKLYSAPARWSVQSADAVFSISRYVTRTIVDMGRAESGIHTVLNAIDATRWDSSTDGAELRRELGVPAEAPLLASVSRLFSWKGQRELLQAFASARAQVPDLKLLIVGADAQDVHGGSFTKELEQLAASLGVAEHVVFTGARSDVPRVMAACDVFTLPSFEEPFGLVFLEAMAMGKPVVAVDNGGTPEVVEHGRAGLLSPPYDIPALAKNIVTLVRDPELRARFGAYGKKRVHEYFNAPRMARDAEAAYEAILNA